MTNEKDIIDNGINNTVYYKIVNIYIKVDKKMYKCALISYLRE